MCADLGSYLSTHDLTQRSTTNPSNMRQPIIFQLTTSRRGRHLQNQRERRKNHLSTHDLTQRSTCMATYRLVIELSFNSRPHAEVDSHNSGLSKTLPTFNSRPHAEVDSGLEGEFTTDFFQLTTSRRGRHQYFTYFMQNFDPISYIFHKNHFK